VDPHAKGVPFGSRSPRKRGPYSTPINTFVINRDLEPANNGSERALRPCATFRKVTGGLRTPKGAEIHADARSLLETARRRAIPPLQAIALTLKGRPLPLYSA